MQLPKHGHLKGNHLRGTIVTYTPSHLVTMCTACKVLLFHIFAYSSSAIHIFLHLTPSKLNTLRTQLPAHAYPHTAAFLSQVKQ